MKRVDFNFQQQRLRSRPCKFAAKHLPHPLYRLGRPASSLPGGQIYENLVSGAIDATEWVGPWNDSFMKFYEAAKFYYYPGMHEPAAQLALGMNKKWWDGLSKSDQMIITAAAEMENSVMMSE